MIKYFENKRCKKFNDVLSFDKFLTKRNLNLINDFYKKKRYFYELNNDKNIYYVFCN